MNKINVTDTNTNTKSEEVVVSEQDNTQSWIGSFRRTISLYSQPTNVTNNEEAPNPQPPTNLEITERSLKSITLANDEKKRPPQDDTNSGELLLHNELKKSHESLKPSCQYDEFNLKAPTFVSNNYLGSKELSPASSQAPEGRVKERMVIFQKKEETTSNETTQPPVERGAMLSPSKYEPYDIDTRAELERCHAAARRKEEEKKKNALLESNVTTDLEDDEDEKSCIYRQCREDFRNFNNNDKIDIDTRAELERCHAAARRKEEEKMKNASLESNVTTDLHDSLYNPSNRVSDTGTVERRGSATVRTSRGNYDISSQSSDSTRDRKFERRTRRTVLMRELQGLRKLYHAGHLTKEEKAATLERFEALSGELAFLKDQSTTAASSLSTIVEHTGSILQSTMGIQSDMSAMRDEQVVNTNMILSGQGRLQESTQAGLAKLPTTEDIRSIVRDELRSELRNVTVSDKEEEEEPKEVKGGGVISKITSKFPGKK